MRIVCVVLDIFISGMVLPILLIFRYWNHSRWHLGRKGFQYYCLWYCSADCRLLRYWLRLELDLGYLHCDAEAGVLNRLCVMFVGTLFCSWKIVFWPVLVFKVSRHGIRRLQHVCSDLQPRPNHHTPFYFLDIVGATTIVENSLQVENLYSVANVMVNNSIGLFEISNEKPNDVQILPLSEKQIQGISTIHGNPSKVSRVTPFCVFVDSFRLRIDER